MKRVLLACLILSLPGCVRGIPRFPLPRAVPVKVPSLPRMVRPPVPAPMPARVAPGLAGVRQPLPVVRAADDSAAGHLSHFGGHLHHLLPDDDKKERSR